MEIADICNELRALARSKVLKDPAVIACSQAIPLLKSMRQVVLTGRSPEEITARLKRILAEQGEG